VNLGGEMGGTKRGKKMSVQGAVEKWAIIKPTVINSNTVLLFL
jgi:hypothetical protein